MESLSEQITFLYNCFRKSVLNHLNNAKRGRLVKLDYVSHELPVTDLPTKQFVSFSSVEVPWINIYSVRNG